MKSPRIRLENICKNFGGQTIIKDFSLSLSGGQVLALLGDNGAGKSTLIKIMAGYHLASSGSIYWEGEALDKTQFSPEKARKMGIQTVYQHLGLIDQLSIARNFFLGFEPLKRFGPFKWLDKSYMREIVKKELVSMGIKRKLDPEDAVQKLSGGERQAIAISRARFFGAKLLILDEPTSALSLRQTQEVLDYISYAASTDISVIFITHTLHHIEKIVDKIAILHHGHCVGHYSAGSISAKECAQLIIHGQFESN